MGPGQGHSRQKALPDPKRQRVGPPHIPECGKRAADQAGGAGRARLSRSVVFSVTSSFTNVSLSRFRTIDTWDSSDGLERGFSDSSLNLRKPSFPVLHVSNWRWESQKDLKQIKLSPPLCTFVNGNSKVDLRLNGVMFARSFALLPGLAGARSAVTLSFS